MTNFVFGSSGGGGGTTDATARATATAAQSKADTNEAGITTLITSLDLKQNKSDSPLAVDGFISDILTDSYTAVSTAMGLSKHIRFGKNKEYIINSSLKCF